MKCLKEVDRRHLSEAHDDYVQRAGAGDAQIALSGYQRYTVQR